MLKVFERMAFKRLAGISLTYDENTYDRQSTSYETVLIFHVWLEEMFSNSSCLVLMENLVESAVVPIWAVFFTGKQVDSPKVF